MPRVSNSNPVSGDFDFDFDFDFDTYINLCGQDYKIYILFSCPVVAILPQKNRKLLPLRRLLELLMLRTVPELEKVYPLHVRPHTFESTFCIKHSLFIHEYTDASNVAKAFGYTEEQLKAVPEAAHMGLSCGNPIATASIKEVN